MQPTPNTPIFRPLAEHAVLVEFGTVLDQAAHQAVIRLDQALAAQRFVGFRESVPALVNLLVEFDTLATDHPTVIAHLRGLLTAQTIARPQPAQREVLICYDTDLAPDLAAVAQQSGLTPEAVINAHVSGDYAVFMYGFAPGYAYLGGVPGEIRRDRKPSPVRGVAAGSGIIAGAQCLITTLLMPTGWWIIGRSPTAILTRDPARPVRFDVGDKVHFRRISRAEYEAAQ